mgnify:CR=1 FL=1
MLANKVTLILGGTRGIGFATAKKFVENNAKQVIVTGTNPRSIDKASKLLPKAQFIQSDMSDPVQTRVIFKQVIEEHGSLDVVFVNAGIAEPGAATECTEAAFDKQSNLNFKGAFFAGQAAGKYMTPRGSLIYVSSVAGFMGIDKNISVYSATKAAVISLGKTLAAEYSKIPLRVNVISPGYIETELSKRNNAADYSEVCESIPLEQRFGTTEELAEAALFLASNRSSYITGVNLPVDGGYSSITPAGPRPKL